MQRMDELELTMVHQPKMQEYEVCRFDELTHNEREAFLLLYEHKDHTFKSLASRMGMSDEQVKRVIANLIVKGVPILKRYTKEGMSIGLDQAFLLTQRQRNIMDIDQGLLAP